MSIVHIEFQMDMNCNKFVHKTWITYLGVSSETFQIPYNLVEIVDFLLSTKSLVLPQKWLVLLQIKTFMCIFTRLNKYQHKWVPILIQFYRYECLNLQRIFWLCNILASF